MGIISFYKMQTNSNLSSAWNNLLRSQVRWAGASSEHNIHSHWPLQCVAEVNKNAAAFESYSNVRFSILSFLSINCVIDNEEHLAISTQELFLLIN